MNRSADRPAGSSPLRWAYFDGRQNRLRDVAWEAVSLLEAHGPSIVMRRSGRTQALEVSLGLRLVRLRRLALGHPVAEGGDAGRGDGLATVRLALPGRIRVHRPGVAESLVSIGKERSYGKGVGHDAALRLGRRHRCLQRYTVGYVARRLIDQGVPVRTLSRRPAGRNPLAVWWKWPRWNFSDLIPRSSAEGLDEPFRTLSLASGDSSGRNDIWGLFSLRSSVAFRPMRHCKNPLGRGNVPQASVCRGFTARVWCDSFAYAVNHIKCEPGPRLYRRRASSTNDLEG